MKDNFFQGWKKRLQEAPVLKQLLDLTKTRSLPGLEGIPMYDVFVFFRNEVGRDLISIRSRAIAFSFLLALFPTIIFVFTLIPYIPIQDFDQFLLDLMKDVLPLNAFQTLASTIEDLVLIPRGGLLSLGFVLAIWFSANGIFVMLNTFNKMHKETFRQRKFWEKRLVAFQLMFILFMLLVLSIVFIIAGNALLNWALDFLNWGRFSKLFASLLKWIILLFLFYSAISAIYRYGPSMRKKFGYFSPGATIATILSILTSLGFSFFVNNFGRFNQFYGSIGTLIVAMIWLNLNALILLVGFELNASVAIQRDLKERIEDE